MRLVHYISEVFKARVLCGWFTTLARYSRHVFCAAGSLPKRGIQGTCFVRLVHYLSEIFKACVLRGWFTTLARYSRHVFCVAGSLP